MSPAYCSTAARLLNPHLNINPSASRIGCENAVLTGTSKRYFVPDFEGSLSLKSVIRGVSNWKVNGREFRVFESSVLAVNDRQPYTIIYDEPRPVTTFCVFFKRGFVEDVARTLTLDAEALLSDPYCQTRLEFPVHLESQASDVLQKLRHFAAELGARALAEEDWNRHFFSLACALIRHYRSGPINLAERIPAIKSSVRQELLSRVNVAKDFILSSNDTNTTLEQISRAACLSPFHLQRTFTQVFGQSPHAFLKEHRLARASHLLRSTQSSIATICHDVGFQSVSSFSAAFQERFGISPLRFRKKR